MLWTVDYRLGIKHGLAYKSGRLTKCSIPTTVHVLYWLVVTYIMQYMYKWEQNLLYVCTLRSIIHLFSDPFCAGRRLISHAPNSSGTKHCSKNFCVTYQCSITLFNLWIVTTRYYYCYCYYQDFVAAQNKILLWWTIQCFEVHFLI